MMQLYIAGAAALSLGAGVMGWTARDWLADSQELDRVNQIMELKDEAEDREFANANRYLALVEEVNSRTNTDRTTIREIYREAKDNGELVECRLPERVVGVLNDGIEAANRAAATGSVDPPMPPAPED